MYNIFLVARTSQTKKIAQSIVADKKCTNTTTVKRKWQIKLTLTTEYNSKSHQIPRKQRKRKRKQINKIQFKANV